MTKGECASHDPLKGRPLSASFTKGHFCHVSFFVQESQVAICIYFLAQKNGVAGAFPTISFPPSRSYPENCSLIYERFAPISEERELLWR